MSGVDDPGSQGRRLRHLSKLAMLALLAVIAVACGTAEPEGGTGTVVDGVVVDVQGSLTEVQSFQMSLPDGSRLTFVPEAGVLERNGFSPSHLREHAVSAQPISVTYVVVDGENRVTSIGDADEG